MDTKLSTSVRMDYLSFTVPYGGILLKRMLDWLDVIDRKANDFGGMGYTKSLFILDGGRIYWHPDKKGMGIHVRLNPASLSLIDSTPLGLLRVVLGWGATTKRLDLAYDDFDGLLDMDEMYRKLHAGEVCMRFRGVLRMEGVRSGESGRIGHTINVGSRLSESFVRIYDKLLEQTAKAKNIAGIKQWVRVELELKRERAHSMVLLLCEGLEDGTAMDSGEACASVLLGLIDFKELNPDEANKSRLETCGWWVEFVGQIKKVSLSKSRGQKTIDDVKRWVGSQVSTSLALLLIAEDDQNGMSGYEFIMACAIDGQKKLKKRHQVMLDAYKDKVQPD